MARLPSELEKYEQYRPQMQTGDAIAFSGTSGFSELIKWATRSPYSHVGIILKSDLGEGFGETVFLVESTTETNQRDFEGKQVIKGVQIHFLSKRLETYPGSVWWVPLKNRISPDGLAQMASWLRQTHNQKVPYDYVQIYGAGLDMFDRYGLQNDPDFSTLFCSELVAKALQIGGAIVDPNFNPSDQTPGDVVLLPCFQNPVELKIYPGLNNLQVKGGK
ncbi:MAG TPA: hypothetical protein IGS52_20955 [Oscillatoriaceae cyanobacterium M33_DOE_052]|uniref:Uncharacterized protein n=1 Tax=Planktothricoides sp. SpSt-374 TaxID=2282167 RepID=A0A7C3VP40_9CYAN|nr:hypothetical protein [Oscillatoriaceae cyanobacterium M33_DOE_052]